MARYITVNAEYAGIAGQMVARELAKLPNGGNFYVADVVAKDGARIDDTKVAMFQSGVPSTRTFIVTVKEK